MGGKDKDANSSVGEISRNTKGENSSQDTDGEIPFKMSREILNQVDDDLVIEESKGAYIDKT